MLLMNHKTFLHRINTIQYLFNLGIELGLCAVYLENLQYQYQRDPVKPLIQVLYDWRNDTTVKATKPNKGQKYIAESQFYKLIKCHTKDYKIGICCFSAKHLALKRKNLWYNLPSNVKPNRPSPTTSVV
jgi:hypothetical protein